MIHYSILTCAHLSTKILVYRSSILTYCRDLAPKGGFRLLLLTGEGNTDGIPFQFPFPTAWSSILPS
jgi:hypothetical protein